MRSLVSVGGEKGSEGGKVFSQIMRMHSDRRGGDGRGNKAMTEASCCRVYGKSFSFIGWCVVVLCYAI